MDKVTRKLSAPYVSPYLRRPLRTLSDALSERETAEGFQAHKFPSSKPSNGGRAIERRPERKSA